LYRLQLLSKLREANVNNSIDTSEAENKVNIVQYSLLTHHPTITMLQVFQSASSKEEYLTNMAKLIFALEIKDFREVHKFCGD
jgi:hypothetical protein